MILRHDLADRKSLVDPCKWPAITTFFTGHGAASLIAPTWLLTAAHVARHLPTEHRHSVKLGEKRYPIARAILHPGWIEAWVEDDTIADTVDLALVELATPVTDIHPFDLYTDSDEVGQEVMVLGTGQRGDGISGGRGNDGQLRRVTNIIDEADACWLKFRFDEPPNCTALEGVCGNGDSGGPALIQRDSHLLLAGVSSWQDQGDKPLGAYGCIEHFARVSRYVAWIRETCEI